MSAAELTVQHNLWLLTWQLRDPHTAGQKAALSPIFINYTVTRQKKKKGGQNRNNLSSLSYTAAVMMSPKYVQQVLTCLFFGAKCTYGELLLLFSSCACV